MAGERAKRGPEERCFGESVPYLVRRERNRRDSHAFSPLPRMNRDISSINSPITEPAGVYYAAARPFSNLFQSPRRIKHAATMQRGKQRSRTEGVAPRLSIYLSRRKYHRPSQQLEQNELDGRELRAIHDTIHVRFDFIQVHYQRLMHRTERERERERERLAREKRTNESRRSFCCWLRPRNCTSHYSNGPRARHTGVYTRLRTRTCARRDACSLCTTVTRTVSNASAFALLLISPLLPSATLLRALYCVADIDFSIGNTR